MLLQDRALTEQVGKIEALLDDVESIPDPALRARMTAIVQGLVVFYGEGLARMLAIVTQQNDHPAAGRLLDAFAEDDLVAHLLLLHDLHPVPVEQRVARALDEVRPYLQSHGGNVELLGVEGGVARVRLQGSCSGCPSSTITLKLAIEEAIRKAAPDLEDIEAEGVTAAPPRPAGFVPLASLRRPDHAAEATENAWTTVGKLPQLADGHALAMETAGLPVVFFKLDGTFYAYRNTCPKCGQALEQGALEGTDLTCLGCAHRYDIRRAGRGLDATDLSLEPIPLLVQDDLVRIAASNV
jgi:Fe-S cluster biogenesis protein NfuA/nitrite reductase/ring-hydroxylating ferredoxin subunit